MNAGTFLVLSVVVLIVVLDIRYLLKNGIDSCGGDCSHCGPSCKWAGDIRKAQRKIRMQRRLKAIFHMK